MDTTRSIVRDGIAVGIATGAYGVSFGAVSVAAGLDVWQTCALSLLVFTGACQFALVGVIASGGSAAFGALSGLLLGTRNTLYGLQVAPRGRLDRLAACGGGARPHRRVDGHDGDPRRPASTPGPASSPPGSRCSCCGTWPPWSARWPATPSATRAPTASTRRSAAPSSGCCGLAWTPGPTGWPRCSAAALALALVPVVPAGVPVLAATVVALGIGLLGRDASRTTGRPAGAA